MRFRSALAAWRETTLDHFLRSLNTGFMEWTKRLDSFLKACKELEEACVQGTYNKLERGGLIQAFEFTFELAWKTAKDWLEWQGYSAKSPRQVIRTLLETGLVPSGDVETLLDALAKCNLLAHTYTEALAQTAVSLIRNSISLR